jgi:polygalacturonase
VVHLASTETVTDAKTFNAGAFLDKGNLVFNVKAYGAVGDGVMDDKAALQAAHDAIGSAGGKIYVPAGTYLMNSKWLISKSNIEIELAPGAVLKAAAGAANLSVGAGGGLVHIWKSSGTQTNVYFHGGAIDLNNVAEVNALEIWGAGSDADIWATTDNPGPLDLSPRRTLRPHTPQQHGPIIISQQQRPHTVRHGQLSRDKH